MFGLSLTAALLTVVIGGNTLGSTEAAASAHSSYIVGIFTYLGWTLFVALFLGWLAAIGGASTAHKQLPTAVLQHQRQVRHA